MDLFPILEHNEQIAAMLLRVVLGMTLAYFAWQKIRAQGDSSGSNSATYGYVELLVALFLVAGFFTQLAALINAIILMIKIGFKFRENKLLSHGINYYLLLLTIAVAVVLIGPGIWSFDGLF